MYVLGKNPQTHTKEQHSRTAYDNRQTYGYNYNKGLLIKTPFNNYVVIFMCRD